MTDDYKSRWKREKRMKTINFLVKILLIICLILAIYYLTTNNDTTGYIFLAITIFLCLFLYKHYLFYKIRKLFSNK